MKTILSIELLEKHIAECKEFVEAGLESPEQLQFYLDLREKLNGATEEDWEHYSELANHIPDEGADDILIVLKGQMLIEKSIRKFIESRLQNPHAFEQKQFTAAQCITIAESMCLEGENPKWLWTQVKELNTIRNKLVHNLETDHLETRISNFVSTVSNKHNLEERTLRRVVTLLNGMLKGLNSISDSDDYRIKK